MNNFFLLCEDLDFELYRKIMTILLRLLKAHGWQKEQQDMAITTTSRESLGCCDDYPSFYNDVLSYGRFIETSLVR